MKQRVMTYLLIAILGMIAVACTGGEHDARLLRAELLMADSLPHALAVLDSIDPSSLDKANRNLRDLLTIKGADKAYVKHTSDSAILQLVEYYSNHQSTGRYPEALYYAGRVYSDLGDYPTALKYFHDALDALPDHSRHTNVLQLKGNILSQTGYLLNSLRLHSEAIPYLERSIEIGKCLSDTLAVIYDTELLGAVNMHMENYREAEDLFKNAMQMAKPFPDLVARQQMYIAAVYLSQGSIDKALKSIRGVPERFKENEKPMAIAYAARIYHESGISDTAALYARELVKYNKSSHGKTGYAILLSKNIIGIVPRDTIADYIANYTSSVEETLERNGNTAALMQHSLYNYTSKERDKNIAEKRANVMRLWAVAATFLVFIGVIFILVLKNKNSQQYISLLKSKEIISELLASVKDDIERECGEDIKSDMEVSSLVLSENADMKALRESLISNLLLLLSKTSDHQVVIPEIITDSKAYGEMKACLQRKQIIVDTSPLWDELEAVVISASKNFKRRFNILIGSRPKIMDYHIALLIKCGLTPSEMIILLPMTKGGLSSRRTRLGEKAFDKKLPNETVDKLIRLL